MSHFDERSSTFMWHHLYVYLEAFMAHHKLFLIFNFTNMAHILMISFAFSFLFFSISLIPEFTQFNYLVKSISWHSHVHRIQFLFFFNVSLGALTLVRRSCRLPLYQVMMAFGREPILSHAISYRRSATSWDGGPMMFTVRGFTVFENEKQIWSGK